MPAFRRVALFALALPARGFAALHVHALSVRNYSDWRPRHFSLRRQRPPLAHRPHRDHLFHPADPNPSGMGDSIGNWEGEADARHMVGK
jgi:hypothetical protein